MHIKDCAILESILTLVSKNGDLQFFPWWWYLHKGNQNLRPTKISQPADSFHPELHSDKRGLIWDPPRKSQRCSQSQTHKENIDGRQEHIYTTDKHYRMFPGIQDTRDSLCCCSLFHSVHFTPSQSVQLHQGESLCQGWVTYQPAQGTPYPPWVTHYPAWSPFTCPANLSASMGYPLPRMGHPLASMSCPMPSMGQFGHHGAPLTQHVTFYPAWDTLWPACGTFYRAWVPFGQHVLPDA